MTFGSFAVIRLLMYAQKASYNGFVRCTLWTMVTVLLSTRVQPVLHTSQVIVAEDWSLYQVYLTTLHTVLSPPAPDSPPALHLRPSALPLHAQPPLHPLPAPHLTQPAQCPRKRKPLLVARENATVFEHVHVHAQVVHEVAHDVGNGLVVIGSGRLLGGDGG